MAPIIIPIGVCSILVVFLAVRRQRRVYQRQSFWLEQDQNATAEASLPSHDSLFNATTTTTTTTATMNSASLDLARELQPPLVTLQMGGEYEHGTFWEQHDPLLKSAWNEWYAQTKQSLPDLMAHQNRMMDPTLVQAVQEVRQHPTRDEEETLKSLCEPIIDGHVYQLPWFTMEGVRMLRQHLDAASYYYNHSSSSSSKEEAAGIPTRRPNGMNRYGIILDPTIEGAVSYEHINHYLHEHLVHAYVRPLARMLFEDVTSRNHPEDDMESYAFTIRYHPDQDMELKEHSDASIYTININLNLPPTPTSLDNDSNTQGGSSYEGSSLYFVDPIHDDDSFGKVIRSDDESQEQQKPRAVTNVSFAPGMAVLHRGIVRHAALPITAGERHNLVIWLFGKHGYVRIGEHPQKERLTVKERWGNGGSSS